MLRYWVVMLKDTNINSCENIIALKISTNKSEDVYNCIHTQNC